MKMKIAQYILEDLKRYLPSVKDDDYIITYNETDPEVIKNIRNFYESKLLVEPIDIVSWMRVNEPKDNLIYKPQMYEQINFMTCNIKELLGIDMRDIKVVSVHESKSIKLPVYFIQTKDYSFMLRCNFYDWNVSVKCAKPLELIGFPTFDIEGKDHCYFQGFPSSWKFRPYVENNRQFSFCVEDNYKLYVFFYMIANSST